MGGNQSTPEDEVEEQPEERAEIEIQKHPITRDYDIKKKLGQGNFALVRLCTKRDTNDNFAVKIIHKRRLNKPKQMRALEREVEILKNVDHPYCVHLEAIYETTNHLYLVLEYCEGGELFDMICKYNHFTEQQATNVVRQVTEALQYLHNLGIVHRDIKPENILLLERTPDSVVKLTDFGLANKLDGKDLKFWTKCGTLYYAAPEVLSTDSYDKKIDFWSLGVVMYVLLVGYLPFYHDNRNKTIDLIRRARVPFDMTDWGNISAEARDLIRRLLQFDPARRYDCEQIFSHPWMSGSAGEGSINLERIAAFKEERIGFQNTVATLVGIQRWKEAALAHANETSSVLEDEDINYDGVGLTVQETAENSESSAKPVATENDRNYIPGIGHFVE